MFEEDVAKGVQKYGRRDLTTFIANHKSDTKSRHLLCGGASESNMPTSEPSEYIIQAFPNGVAMWPLRGGELWSVPRAESLARMNREDPGVAFQTSPLPSSEPSQATALRSLEQLERQVVAVGESGSISAFLALCDEELLVSEYLRGDDRFVSVSPDDFMLHSFDASSTYVLRQTVIMKGQLKATDTGSLREFLKLVRETFPHQRFRGDSISVGHVPEVRGSAVVGRVTSNVEWGVFVGTTGSKSLRIRHLVIGLHR